MQAPTCESSTLKRVEIKAVKTETNELSVVASSTIILARRGSPVLKVVAGHVQPTGFVGLLAYIAPRVDPLFKNNKKTNGKP